MERFAVFIDGFPAGQARQGRGGAVADSEAQGVGAARLDDELGGVGDGVHAQVRRPIVRVGGVMGMNNHFRQMKVARPGIDAQIKAVHGSVFGSLW